MKPYCIWQASMLGVISFLFYFFSSASKLLDLTLETDGFLLNIFSSLLFSSFPSLFFAYFLAFLYLTAYLLLQQAWLPFSSCRRRGFLFAILKLSCISLLFFLFVFTTKGIRIPSVFKAFI